MASRLQEIWNSTWGTYRYKEHRQWLHPSPHHDEQENLNRSFDIVCGRVRKHWRWERHFYSSVEKHFRHTPKFFATELATELINVINSTKPQTKVILDNYHLNKNQQVHVRTHAYKIDGREDFDRMNDDLYLLH